MEESTPSPFDNAAAPTQIESGESSQEFVGRWNRLVSTTNWEKGKIIHEWREALVDENADPADYSDERWAMLVGGVTGQHVGRLRRVHRRFGESFQEYNGLYWSHFFAALDWDDAEMWLEGALQSKWSVSQMRRQRWETVDQSGPEPRDSDVVRSETDEDFEPALQESPGTPSTIAGTFDEANAGPRHDGPDFGDAEELSADASHRESSADGASIYAGAEDDQTIDFVRPFENLSELPSDLADAFESFKLAILRHKTENWSEIPRADVLASLDALKELAMAPTRD